MIRIHDFIPRFATRPLALAAVCIACAVAEVHAQDSKAYMLRFDPTFEVGDRWRFTQISTQDLKRTKTPAEGDKTTEESKSQIDLVGICTAKAVSKDRAWTEIVMEIEKCAMESNGKNQEILSPGTALIVAIKEGKRTIRFEDGTEIPAAKERVLSMALGGSQAEDKSSLAKVFALSTARKVGEEWAPDKDLLVKAFEGFAKGLTANDVEGAAKFDSVERKDSKSRLLWSAKMRVSTTNPPVAVPGGVPVLGSFDWKGEQELPATGRRGLWRKKVAAELKQVFKGAPKSKDAETIFEGRSDQVYETKVEFLDK